MRRCGCRIPMRTRLDRRRLRSRAGLGNVRNGRSSRSALRTPAGCMSELSQSALMLVLRTGFEQDTFTVETPPGTTLVFYMIVEVVHDIDAGFRRLRGALQSDDVLAHAPHPAEALVDAVLGSDEPRDDIAVLVVTFGAQLEQRAKLAAPRVERCHGDVRHGVARGRLPAPACARSARPGRRRCRRRRPQRPSAPGGGSA